MSSALETLSPYAGDLLHLPAINRIWIKFYETRLIRSTTLSSSGIATTEATELRRVPWLHSQGVGVSQRLNIDVCIGVKVNVPKK